MKDGASKNWLAAGILVIITAAAYLPAVSAGFIWDDDQYVTDNPLLSAPDGLRRIWFSQDTPSQYFPMTYTTFRLQYSLWKLNPAGYHITNILLHSVNALLLWILLRRLSIPAAWFAAALWALHPVNVESVAWITELKNILMVLFSLLSLLAWSKFAECPQENRRRWYFYSAALLLYVIALFSKTTACTLPAALVLMLWLKRAAITTKRCLQIAPFVILGFAMGLFVVWWERVHCGTRTLNIDLNLPERILLAARALWFYPWKLLWPFNLSFSYTQWNIDWTQPIQYAPLFACLITAFFIWYWRNRLGRGAIAAVVFFAATLFPMLGFFSLYTFFFTYVADHYQYMACIGPISLAVAAGSLAAARLGSTGKTIAAITGVCLLAFLGLLTFRQCRIYKNQVILWEDTLRKNPDSWIAHNNLARELESLGKLDEALTHCREAVRLAPYRVEVLYNLAFGLKSQGKFDEALEYFQKAVENMDKNGDPYLYTEVYTDLASVLYRKGNYEQAFDYLTKALEYKPDNFRAQFGLANICAKQGKTDSALFHIDKALSISPDSDEAANFKKSLLKQ